MEIKSYEQIYRDMQNYIIAHQDKLTDFNDGGVLASQIEAVAREIALLYIQCRVGFSTFLRDLPYSVFNFKMKSGLKASARVVFSRSKPYTYNTIIPAGVIVSTGSLSYVTTQAAEVSAGETNSLPVNVSAQAAGEQYNTPAGTIKTIVSTLPADIVAVNNYDPATGGTDAEDWGKYLDRFAEYILGLQRTNAYGFWSALTEDNLVRSLTIEEHFPPLDDIWNMTVYLEDGSGGMSPDGLRNVKSKIDGDGTAANGGFRAPGINVRYLTPEIVPVTLHIQVTINRDLVNDMDEVSAISGVREAVQKTVNALKIGEEVKRSDIIIALRRIYYISDAAVLNPLANVAVSNHQIARYEDCVVSLGVL
jgi:uncharacterized phage protein gp47/JayE